MKPVDRWLQQWRIAKAQPFLKSGMRILDIGCGEGELLGRVSGLAEGSLGLDPTLASPRDRGSFRLRRGLFPQDMPADAGPFDAMTMLAVLEHIPAEAYPGLEAAAYRYLRPGGALIITVPAPAVDRILEVLKSLHVLDGMSLEEHHGFDVRLPPKIFSPPRFELQGHWRFQLGLNNLFVFRRSRNGADNTGPA